MKTLIYQCWFGPRPTYSLVSERLFRAYAERISADYLFSDQPINKSCFHKQYFGTLRPVFDLALHTYDAVLFVDMDVIPIEGISDNIFDDLEGDFMMVEEVDQPRLRKNMAGKINSENDLKWASVIKKAYRIEVPRAVDGAPKIYNSGAVLFSGDGLAKLRSELPSIALYQMRMALRGLPRFYLLDQNYIGAFLPHKSFNFRELDSKWNSQVTSVSTQNGETKLLDYRTPETRFIHMQHGPCKTQMTEEETMSVSHGSYQF